MAMKLLLILYNRSRCAGCRPGHTGTTTGALSVGGQTIAGVLAFGGRRRVGSLQVPFHRLAVQRRPWLTVHSCPGL